jgi:hypothetical protein
MLLIVNVFHDDWTAHDRYERYPKRADWDDATAVSGPAGEHCVLAARAVLLGGGEAGRVPSGLPAESGRRVG